MNIYKEASNHKIIENRPPVPEFIILQYEQTLTKSNLTKEKGLDGSKLLVDIILLADIQS